MIYILIIISIKGVKEMINFNNKGLVKLKGESLSNGENAVRSCLGN